MADLIDRQAAIDAINGIDDVVGCEHIKEALSDAINAVIGVPSAQPTLYGYNIEHLVHIARVMEKEMIRKAVKEWQT